MNQLIFDNCFDLKATSAAELLRLLCQRQKQQITECPYQLRKLLTTLGTLAPPPPPTVLQNHFIPCCFEYRSQFSACNFFWSLKRIFEQNKTKVLVSAIEGCFYHRNCLAQTISVELPASKTSAYFQSI